MVIRNPKIRKLKNISVRIAIVVVAYVALYLQLRRHGHISTLWDSFLEQFSTERSILPLFLVTMLMCLNWSLEALKWRFLIRKSEEISFFRSLKAIFTGISVGTFTPNRLGEFLGRSFVLEKSHPWKVFFMTIIGSYSQLLATIIFGAAGLLFFTYHYAWLSTGFTYLDSLIGFFAVATALFVVLLYFNIDLVDKHIGPWLQKRKPGFAAWFHVISSYSTKDLLTVLLFSLLRYSVFSFQFFLLTRFFDLQIPFWHTMAFTSVVYLAMTIIPSIALSEIGVRGSVALFIFGFYYHGQVADSSSALAILSTSTLLWLINLVFPAILGTFFVYHLRFFRNNKQLH